MQTFIAEARNIEWDINVDITNLPLATIREEFLGRWWARFRVLNQFIDEQAIAAQYHLVVPGDSIDTPVTEETIEQLREIYPRTPDWYTGTQFPAAVPHPMPFVVFYYHNNIRQAETPAERRFWDQIMQHELTLLYATAWYNEAINAHHGFVLPTETVE